MPRQYAETVARHHAPLMRWLRSFDLLGRIALRRLKAWACRLVLGTALGLGYGVLCAQALPLNEQIKQWFQESSTVQAAEQALLLERAQAGDRRAAYLLFWLWRETALAPQHKQRNAALGDAIGQLAQRKDALGQYKWCAATVTGAFELPPDPKAALEQCRAAASAGLWVAMSTLGSIFQEGRGGVAADEAQAFEWRRKGVDAGDVDAIPILGGYYQSGRGTAKDEAHALSLYRKAAQAGHPLGMFNLALMHRNGQGGLEKNDAQAFAWTHKAAEAGHVPAIADLGWLYETGRGTDKDDARALAWHRKAADAGNAVGMNNLAVAYRDGTGALAKDDALAFAWFRKAAEAGNARAMTSLGALYSQGRGTSTDHAQGIAWYRRAAEAGNSIAMHNLAAIYREGLGAPRGLEKNDALAFAWYLKAAELGHADAMSQLGMLYQWGQGVAKDESQALAWFRKSADAGSGYGMQWLGLAYRDGLAGLSKDHAQAMAWNQKAAAKGFSYAMAQIANFFASGAGVARDPQQAAIWNLKAAQGGSELGMYGLGDQYLYGEGVKEDPALAFNWFKKAAEAGHHFAMLTLARAHAKGDVPGVEKSELQGMQWLTKAVEKAKALDRSRPVTGVSNLTVVRRHIDELLIEDWAVTADSSMRISAQPLAGSAPALEWVDVPQQANQPSVPLRVKVRDMGAGIGRIELRINGAAVGLFEAAAAAHAPPAAGTAAASEPAVNEDWVYPLTLPQGQHEVEVRAYNGENLINFARVTQVIHANDIATSKPRLYAVVIGVSEHEDRSLAPHFAASDASAVALQLQRRIDAGALYSGGEVTLLTTKQQTTKASIVQALKRLHNKELVAPADVFMLYVAGHAWFDTRVGRPYLFTSDVQERTRSRLAKTALVDGELRDLVGNVPTQNKLLVLDLCHSGGSPFEGAQLPTQSRNAMREQHMMDALRTRTGASVFALGVTPEEALQGHEGRGLLSYFLLQSLGGAAQREGTASVTTSDLKTHLEEQVQKAIAQKKWAPRPPTIAVQKPGFSVAAKAP